ncbi:hypothetical protein [Salarchaeum japonicum]|uniref:hypothetical protein n=1 Tax=Salarchaeum japonicum TaxID=555573 RepID=UPI003C722A26
MTALTRITTAAAYQTTLALGIALLPLAVLTSRLGLTLPIHRLVARTEHAYENAR